MNVNAIHWTEKKWKKCSLHMLFIAMNFPFFPVSSLHHNVKQREPFTESNFIIRQSLATFLYFFLNNIVDVVFNSRNLVRTHDNCSVERKKSAKKPDQFFNFGYCKISIFGMLCWCVKLGNCRLCHWAKRFW